MTISCTLRTIVMPSSKSYPLGTSKSTMNCTRPKYRTRASNKLTTLPFSRHGQNPKKHSSTWPSKARRMQLSHSVPALFLNISILNLTFQEQSDRPLDPMVLSQFKFQITCLKVWFSSCCRTDLLSFWAWKFLSTPQSSWRMNSTMGTWLLKSWESTTERAKKACISKRNQSTLATHTKFPSKHKAKYQAFTNVWLISLTCQSKSKFLCQCLGNSGFNSKKSRMTHWSSTILCILSILKSKYFVNCSQGVLSMDKGDIVLKEMK